MRCNFCGREVEDGTLECPYCHYIFDVEPKVLDPGERDDFAGLTVDGSGAEYTGSNDSTGKEDTTYQETETSQKAPGGTRIFVQKLGTGKSFLTTVLTICIVLAVLFFVMPMIVIIVGIGMILFYLAKLFA